MMMARSKAATASLAAESLTFTESETLDKAQKRQASVYSLRQQRDADGDKKVISPYALLMKGSNDVVELVLSRIELAIA